MVIPPMNRWAIFGRPLSRTLILLVFVQRAALLFRIACGRRGNAGFAEQIRGFCHKSLVSHIWMESFTPRMEVFAGLMEDLLR